MELEIQSQRTNALLNRTEVHFIIRHEGESTPRRELVRTELAEKLHTKKDHVVIDNMHAAFGVHKTTGYAKVYSSVEKARAGENEYLIKRNNISTGKGKEEQKQADTDKNEEASTSQKAEKPEVKEEKPKEPVDGKKEEA